MCAANRLYGLVILFGSCIAVLETAAADELAPAPRYVVTEVPAALREKVNLDPFYKKHVDVGGLPILSSERVSDEGLIEAKYLISSMLAERPDILAAMAKKGVRFVVMAPTEMTTDVPEQRHMKNDPKTNWDKRARGLGGKLTSCGEENLMNLRGDRYRNENILIHEFSHAVHSQGLRTLDPTFQTRLQATYNKAKEKGLWAKTYAMDSVAEYWAEGAQSYYDCNNPPGGVHNDINTREKLQKYDPDLFALLEEGYGKNPWRYVRYDKRYPEITSARNRALAPPVSKESKPADMK